MSEQATEAKTYTGLILVTSQIKPGIQSAIEQTLSPFTIKILELKTMEIRDRYFLAILFSLDKAHQKAIEKDLVETAERLNVDLAIDFQFAT